MNDPLADAFGVRQEIPCLFPTRKAPRQSEAVQGRRFRDLRAENMTDINRPSVAYLLTGRESLGHIASINSPRTGTSSKRVRRAGTHYGEKSHGIARAFESLRGMRLPLVPFPGSADGLLPGV